MAKDKVTTLADELENNLYQQEELKAILKPLEEKETEIRAEILKGLERKGYDSVRTSSGMGFVRVKGRVTWAIKKGLEDKAIAWAIKEFPGVLSIAAAKLNKVVQPMLQPPEFVERKEGEPFLSVKSTE